MRKFFGALFFFGVLAAGCTPPPPEPPPVDAVKVQEARQTLANCVANEWDGCRGGFIRLVDDPVLRQIIVPNAGSEVSNEMPSYNEITSDQLLENAAEGEEGDRYLNGITFIWPSDRALWEAAMIEWGRTRT